NTKCSRIDEDCVTLEKDGETIRLDCDAVVIAVGSQPKNYDEIKGYSEEHQIPYYIIGDARKARKAIDAIAEAAELARII
ncbi:MAG: NADH oxidase, partial [Clostridiales bacterium]|nr:NADH oxidase [Clostridiales bacterium]